MVDRADPPPTPQPVGSAMPRSATAWPRPPPAPGPARRQERGDRRGQVQPVPWVLRVARRGASSQIRPARVSSRSGLVVRFQMAALEQDVRWARAHAGASPPLPSPRAIGRCRAGRAARPASGRLGVIRSASGRSRARRAPIASLPQQAVAALGDHHGVEHDVGRPPGDEALGHGGHRPRAAEHADLDRIDPTGRRTPSPSGGARMPARRPGSPAPPGCSGRSAR